MLTTIESLFEQIRKILKQKRKNKLLFDGKKFWQPIKAILSTTDWKASKWKKQSAQRYDSIMSIFEYHINGHGNTEIIETNHFLIQTVRIPQNEKPSLKKVIQIALNIGQYQGDTDKPIEKSNILHFLSKKDSHVLLKDILHKDKIAELEKLLRR